MSETIVDKIEVECNATITVPQSSGQVPTRRTWFLSIQINDSTTGSVFADPISQEDYDRDFERYIRKSAKVLAGAAVDSGLRELHKRVENYRDALVRALGLDDMQAVGSKLKHGSTKCVIKVIQRDPVTDLTYGVSGKPSCASIHRIHWELLEHVTLSEDWGRPDYAFLVQRVTSLQLKLPHRSSLLLQEPRYKDDGAYYKRILQAKEPLETVARDSTKTFKILLVLARNLSPKKVEPASRDIRISKDELGAGPHLAQWPIMRVQKDLEILDGSHRLVLEVVRPGSLEELNGHLSMRQEQRPPIRFNVVHFDLHGRITEQNKKDQNGVKTGLVHTSGLRFAKGSQFPEAEDLANADAKDIAKVLARFEIENVVMNSCWSAYARYGRQANMSELFVREGVKSVLGMWGPANDLILPQFLESFYRFLLVRRFDFETAVSEARADLRRDTNRWGDSPPFADDFICVQYRRGPAPVSREQKLRRHTKIKAFRDMLRNLHRHQNHSSLQPSKSPTESVGPRRSRNRRSGSVLRVISPLRKAEPEPELIKLELLFLKLELCLMHKNPFIYAHDTYNKTYLDTRTTDPAVDRIRCLGYIWQKTGFVRRVEFFEADSFELSADATPRLVFSTTGCPVAPRATSKVLYIIEGADIAVAGLNREEHGKEGVKRNLNLFLRSRNWNSSYVIILTRRSSTWWESQDWIGTKTGSWWSFRQDSFMPTPMSHTDVPSPGQLRSPRPIHY